MANTRKSIEPKKTVIKRKATKNVVPDASDKLIEELLLRTKERWLKESSFAIMCCTENRTGTGIQ
jgi:hypothetical protein